MKLFTDAFMIDEGKRLTAIISNVNRTAARIWEFPKGHLDIGDGSPLVCAIREFSEETGIDKKYYKYIPDKYIDHEYISGGTIYQVRYYIAIAPEIISPRIGIHNICEITDAKWLNINEIKMVGNIEMCKMARKAFAIMRGSK